MKTESCVAQKWCHTGPRNPGIRIKYIELQPLILVLWLWNWYYSLCVILCGEQQPTWNNNFTLKLMWTYPLAAKRMFNFTMEMIAELILINTIDSFFLNLSLSLVFPFCHYFFLYLSLSPFLEIFSSITTIRMSMAILSHSF